MTRALWEYVHDDRAIDASDEQFSQGGELELDEAILNDIIRPPGVVVDLGCGIGRLAVPLARRGLRCVAVDLSHAALKAVERHARAAALPIDCLLANLVDFDCLRDRSADYCMAMYSTLGMIRGRDNRLQALRHVRRILKPGGTLVVHVHNRWHNIFQPQSRWWLAVNLAKSLARPNVEAGDKFFDYHGVPNMFLHVYTRGELVSDLRRAGFRIERLIPLSTERRETLRAPWFLGWLRAGGWIAVCR